MNQEVFKISPFSGILFKTIFLAVLAYFYYVKSMPVEIPFLLAIVIIVASAILDSRKSLIIENDLLCYRRLFKYDEVSLKEVSQIALEHESSRDSDGDTSITSAVYVKDELGRMFFSFPPKLVRAKDTTRFKEAVTSVNPNIKVF